MAVEKISFIWYTIIDSLKLGWLFVLKVWERPYKIGGIRQLVTGKVITKQKVLYGKENRYFGYKS